MVAKRKATNDAKYAELAKAKTASEQDEIKKKYESVEGYQDDEEEFLTKKEIAEASKTRREDEKDAKKALEADEKEKTRLATREQRLKEREEDARRLAKIKTTYNTPTTYKNGYKNGKIYRTKANTGYKFSDHVNNTRRAIGTTRHAVNPGERRNPGRAIDFHRNPGRAIEYTRNAGAIETKRPMGNVGTVRNPTGSLTGNNYGNPNVPKNATGSLTGRNTNTANFGTARNPAGSLSNTTVRTPTLNAPRNAAGSLMAKIPQAPAPVLKQGIRSPAQPVQVPVQPAFTKQIASPYHRNSVMFNAGTKPVTGEIAHRTSRTFNAGKPNTITLKAPVQVKVDVPKFSKISKAQTQEITGTPMATLNKIHGLKSTRSSKLVI